MHAAKGPEKPLQLISSHQVLLIIILQKYHINPSSLKLRKFLYYTMAISHPRASQVFQYSSCPTLLLSASPT